MKRIKAWANYLQLPIARKTVGILEGTHPSIFKGIGYDFEEFSIYQPGDNIKHINWGASARASVPVVKRFRANSNTNMCFILDSGREMVTRTTSGERKIDVVHNICYTFGYLASKRLDAVGIVAGDETRIMNERAKLNFGEMQVTLKKIAHITSEMSPRRAFGNLLEYCNQFFTKRTFMVVIVDETTLFYSQATFVSYIRKLKERHDILVITIRSINPFKQRLPSANGRVIDILSYSYLPSYFRNQKVERIAKKVIILNRKSICDKLKHIGVVHLDILGTNDFFKKLPKAMMRREVKHF